MNIRTVHGPRDDEGSIAVMAIVIMVATSLVLAMLLVVERGMWASRRAGDSANALQVADAGINAAVQFIPTVPATQSAVGPVTATVGEGTYTYTATKVDDQTWNVSSTGRDRSGVERRVVAQAVAQPLFGRPIYIRSTAAMKAGSILDSYKDASNRCTGMGVMTVDSPGQLSFTGQGSGVAVTNCSEAYAADPKKWEWGVDGCDIPGDESQLGDPVPYKNDAGDNIIDKARCPPEPHNLPAAKGGTWGPAFGTKRVAPKLTPQPVAPPKSAQVYRPQSPDAIPGSTLECDALRPLESGKVYYYDQINLLHGCYIQNVPAGLTFSMKPTSLFANKIVIGKKQGSNDAVNAPRMPTCPDWISATESTAYCPLWASHLQLNIIGPGTLTFENSLRQFWGVINAPEGTVDNKAQQLEVWGASVSNSFTSGVQYKWHFDESLRHVIGTGRFGVDNWREEGTGTA